MTAFRKQDEIGKLQGFYSPNIEHLFGVKLHFPQPLLHPAEASRVEHLQRYPSGALLAVARGEAWWHEQPCLPPGRCWTDSRPPPLWQWPPVLHWPPPTWGSPEWRAQQDFIHRTARRHWYSEHCEQTGAPGLLALQRHHRDLSLLVHVPQLNTTDAVVSRWLEHLRVWHRLTELNAPHSILQDAHRQAQMGLERIVGTPATHATARAA